MNIVQIGAAYVGAQKQIEKSIHDYAMMQGHNSYVFFANGNSDHANVTNYETKFAWFIRKISTRLFKSSVGARISTRQLIRRLEEIQPDIVHLHVIHHGYLDWEYMFEWLIKKQKPVIITVHDMWNFTGGCYHYHAIKCEEYKNGCKACPAPGFILDCKEEATAVNFEKKMQLYNAIERLQFVAVSDWVAKEIRCIAPQYDVCVIHNAIESVTDTIEPSPKNKFRIVGVAANWTEKKGIHHFFELARRLDPSEFEIVLVGTVDEECKANAPDGIHFIGRKNDKKELYAILKSADIHISMSMEETFGMTFIEAAINGVKSIGFKSTAIPGILAQINGFVVPPCDINSIAQLVLEIKKGEKNGRLSVEELEKTKELFSAQSMAKKYLNLYEKATDKHLVSKMREKA